MAQFASALRDEVVRLSRKQIRSEGASIKRQTSQHRKAIAALKKQVVDLQRQIALLRSRSRRETPAEAPDAEGSRSRFSTKGLRSLRTRLGLSAREFGQLLGVSEQSIYNWEAGSVRPRPSMIEAIARARTMGKREVRAKLAEVT